MFPIQGLGVECKVCLSHPGSQKVTKPIFSNSGKHYSLPESLRIFVFSRIFIKANKIIFLKHFIENSKADGIFWG